MTIVIVKISIPKVKTAVLKNLPIFGENSSHKASVCLRAGGLKRYLAEFHFNSTCVTQGLPLHTSGWTLFPMKCDDAKLLHVCTCINCQVLHIPFLGCKFSINTFLDGLKTMLLPRKVSCLQLFRVEQKNESHILFISVQWSLLFLSFQSKHLFSNAVHGTHMAILWMPGHQTWKHMTMFVCAILLVLNIHLRDAINGKKVTKVWT